MKTFIASILLTGLLTAAGRADTTPPTIAITSPSSGSVVSGFVTVSGTAKDDTAIARVEIAIDGVNFTKIASGTLNWTFGLNTSTLTNAQHGVVARAVDTSGNARVAWIVVTVNNSTGTNPPSSSSGTVTIPSTSSGTIIISSGSVVGSSGTVTIPSTSSGTIIISSGSVVGSSGTVSIPSTSSGTVTNSSGTGITSGVPFPKASEESEIFGLKESFAYPNPSRGDAKICLILGLADTVDLRIYNEIGEKVQEATLNQVSVINNQYAYEYKVSGLPSGVYLYTAAATKNGEIIRTKGKFAVVK